MVEGGGCAGFQYKFDMLPADKATAGPDSIVFERDGVKVVSDLVTLEMINGSSIEYKEEMIRSSFEVVGNP
jgi:iron-sulfur cluster assembly accessory protein